jgi:RES domain-containing protein
MRIWRLTRAAFADLSGEGARLAGGRWNNPGLPMVYAADSPSLALLEVFIHLDLPPHLLPDDYVHLEIETGDLAIEDAPLPREDRNCREFGDRWLAGLRTPLLRVPSMVVPLAKNYLLNPRHPEAPKAQIIGRHGCAFDQRLWKSANQRLADKE